MSPEENKAIVRRVVEAVNKHDLSIIDDLYSPDYVYYLNSPIAPGGVLRGREATKQLAAGIYAAFPDYQVTVEEMIAEGDKVVCRTTQRGTHRGDLADMPATGKQVSWAGVLIIRLTGGRIDEVWALTDGLGLRQQLGLLPS